MFHTIITIAYLIPNIYVFLRIGQLFINKGYKIHYAIIYLLFVSIYPISNLFSHENSSDIAIILSEIANYILPFYLYLFIFLLLFDILILTNHLLKIIPTQKIKSTIFKTTSLSLLLFSSLMVVAAGVINFNTIRISEYFIDIPKKYSKIDHLRIAFVADFHLEEKTNIHFVERFVKKIDHIGPDILLFGGDVVEGDREGESMVFFEKMFKDIHPKYGVFTVLGNHEYYGGHDKGSFFDKAGIRVLTDTIVAIDKSFNLGGRYDSHFKSRKNVNTFLNSLNDSLPTILIDHRPTEVELVSKNAVDIQLSGHTHNGQLFPINLIINKLYRIARGYEKIGNTHFFVTSGIRLWGPPVRTTGKSEIMVINIGFTK